ncbi:MAG: inorganic phosphate transporter [Candidatus Hecatellaceae archaeon]
MAETALLLYVVGLFLTIPIAWSLGANDAANPTDCAVGSGAISLRKALTLFALATAAGAILQGHMVMKTVDRGIVPRIEIAGAFVVVVSVCLWLFLCTWKGMPVSTTHTTVGAVIGYGAAAYGLNRLNLNVLSNVFIGFAASPLISLVMAIGILRLLEHGLPRLVKDAGRRDKVMLGLIVLGLVFSAYSFGANDIANVTGVYVTITKEIGGMPDRETMILLALLGSGGIALGGFTWGYRVIETAGRKITRLNLTTGLSAELANALTVYLFTTVPYLLIGWGLPVSTTHSSVGSIIGVGLARGARTVNKVTVLKILAAWALTLPCAFLLSFGMFKLVSWLLV